MTDVAYSAMISHKLLTWTNPSGEDGRFIAITKATSRITLQVAIVAAASLELVIRTIILIGSCLLCFTNRKRFIEITKLAKSAAMTVVGCSLSTSLSKLAPQETLQKSETSSWNPVSKTAAYIQNHKLETGLVIAGAVALIFLYYHLPSPIKNAPIQQTSQQAPLPIQSRIKVPGFVQTLNTSEAICSATKKPLLLLTEKPTFTPFLPKGDFSLGSTPVVLLNQSTSSPLPEAAKIPGSLFNSSAALSLFCIATLNETYKPDALIESKSTPTPKTSSDEEVAEEAPVKLFVKKGRKEEHSLFFKIRAVV